MSRSHTLTHKSLSEEAIHFQNEIEKIASIKPYQGCHPKDARIIFIGQDANWPANPNPKLAKKIFSYLKGPETFIKKYDVHHPLICTNEPGAKYHRNIAEVLNRVSNNEKLMLKLCFLEINPIPTFGLASKNVGNASKPLSLQHLVKPLACASESAVFFVTLKVLPRFKAKFGTTYNLRQNLHSKRPDKVQLLNSPKQEAKNKIFLIYHPSATQFSGAYAAKVASVLMQVLPSADKDVGG